MWTRLDDHFATHPKIVAAGPLAGWLYVCALCYASLHRTDGFVPRAAIAMMASFDGIQADPADLAATLVRVGLWNVTADGWVIHDFRDYNPTRSAIEQKREQISAARRSAGQRSGFVRRARSMTAGIREQTTNKRGTKTNPSTKPTPVPSHEMTSTPTSRARAEPDIPDENAGATGSIDPGLRRGSGLRPLAASLPTVIEHARRAVGN